MGMLKSKQLESWMLASAYKCYETLDWTDGLQRDASVPEVAKEGDPTAEEIEAQWGFLA